MRRAAFGAARRGRETFAVGGRRVVLEAIRAGRVRRVLVVPEARETEALREVILAAESAGVALEPLDLTEADRLGVRAHQGVVGLVRPPEELDDRALAHLELGQEALVVVLDGITDPQNFGACARSAEAAGVAVLIARKHRAAPLTPAAVRASAGALLHVPVARVTNVARTLEALGDRGFTAVGLDDQAGETIEDAPAPDRPLALVVGAEDVGISRLVRERCDRLVSIPMPGRTRSLNASAALAVALFGYALRRFPSVEG